MRVTEFKPGDKIFHKSDRYGTASGVVVRVGITGLTIKVLFEPGPTGTIWVRADKCVLQSEWEKQNQG